MSVPTGASASVGATDEQRGRRLGIWSLLMLPAMLLSYVASALVGYGLLQALDLADNESLFSAGAGGYLAAALVVAIMLVPQVVGMWLGARARRLGATGLGGAGVIANAVVAGFWIIIFLANAVLT